MVIKYRWTPNNPNDPNEIDSVTLKNQKRVPNIGELVVIACKVNFGESVEYTGRVDDVITYIGSEIEWKEDFYVRLR